MSFFLKNSKMITFVDLCSGIGGGRLGLEKNGFKCLGFSEILQTSIQTYKTFYDTSNEEELGDLTKLSMDKIPDVDMLIAGFPCQAFSIQGLRKGFEDERGQIIFYIQKILKEKNMKYFILENVKGLTNHNEGETLTSIVQLLDKVGYNVFYQVLKSNDYGLPQKRERIYMVCFRNDLGVEEFSFPKAFRLQKCVDDFLLNDEKLVSNLYVNRPDTYYNNEFKTKTNNKPIRVGIVNKGGQGERIYSTNGIAITLSANGGGVFAKTGGYLVDGKPRRLHQRECARLMGFPDSYIICKNKNQAYKQFGNSVVIDVLQYIAIEIGNKLKGV